MTRVRNDNDFVIQIFHDKNFFAPINFQVFLKHLPGHKESIGILVEQIGQWEGSEKSAQTHRQTHGHPQIIIWIIIFGKFFQFIPTVYQCAKKQPLHHLKVTLT